MSEIDLESAAQRMLANRMDTIRQLKAKNDEATSRQAEADAAERDAAAAWSDATRAGWTADELKQLGFKQPASRRGGRPAGSRTATRTRTRSVERAPGTSDQGTSDHTGAESA